MPIMPDETAAPTPVEIIPSLQGQVSAIASASAPFVYSDIAQTFGFNSGVANITLEAIRFLVIGAKPPNDRVMVAHLRMSVAGLASLKNAINGIELLATLAPDDKSN
jgi:hypothetical protein